MSKRAKKSRDSGSSTKRSRSKGPSGGVKAMDYVYAAAPRGGPPRGPEKKAVDNAVAVYEFNDTGTIGHIGGTVPGSGRWQRIGRQMNYRSVHIKGTIYIATPNVGTVSNEYARLVLVYDKSPNGSTPSMGDILADVDSAGAVTTNSFSGLNLNNSKRFLILRDGRFCLPGNAGAQAMTLTSTNTEDPPISTGMSSLRTFLVSTRETPPGLRAFLLERCICLLFRISPLLTRVLL